MPAEAGVSITVKSARGDLITLRGDNPTEFSNNAYSLLGVEAGQALVAQVAAAFSAALPVGSPIPAQPQLAAVPDPVEQATATVVQAFPGASTVGQPLPQPGVPQEAQGTVAGGEAPPQPGELRVINGETKKWIPAGVSKAGKPYKGFWGKP